MLHLEICFKLPYLWKKYAYLSHAKVGQGRKKKCSILEIYVFKMPHLWKNIKVGQGRKKVGQQSFLPPKIGTGSPK